ncbi:tRNA-splicing endonuclease subunit sen54 n-term domain-containing protein [Sarocladium implicatum]|nr:tRNA-splicing endonuclease subunit sen54 n-term domain-containing protein [Sarocladium implicatum]
MAFDDDDVPNVANASNQDGDDGQTAEDAMEEGVPDYKQFNSLFNKKTVSSKSIRKGEKDFESHGTQAQDNTLEASRQAMEDVLSYTRVHREDTWVRGWLFPDACAHWPEDGAHAKLNMRDRVVVVEHEKGGWVRDAGRTMPSSKETDHPGAGKLWLLPEEALYLVERGTLDLWWPTKSLESLLPKAGSDTEATLPGPDDYDSGLPLSLEAAYSLLLGSEDERGKIKLPKFQVYSHLKRAGFNILRSSSNSHESLPSSTRTPLWEWLLSLLKSDRPIQHVPSGPLVKPGLYRAYAPIYRQLAIIPRHKPSITPTSPTEPEDPFRLFYHIWRPSPTPFSKKNPPVPDFRIAVTDTVNTFVPTLDEITTLLDSTPFEPAPATMQGNGRLYQRLKHGYRNVLVAVVDCGLVNFIRFGEGAFGEELIHERFDAKPSARGGKKGGRGGGRGRGRGRGRGGRGR